MFINIGGKLKGLAYVTSILGMVVSVIVAIVLFCQNSRYNSTIGVGLVTLVGGCLCSWIGGFFTYGFGELIEQQTSIAYSLGHNGSSSTGGYRVTSTWECPSCKHTNPMSRIFCEECGQNRR